ncbi:MAG TPA: aldehyde dehydrogenase family protein, partial [Chitinophagaceae bacterium]|nr:aldehyde dehydrogenase family protein [Chitinophagaceae bacterium]
MNTDVLKNLQLMRGYFQSGKTQTAEFRIEMLQSLKRVILEKEAAIFAALKTDLNKSPEEAMVTEMGLLLQEINYLIRHLRRWMRPQPVRTNWLNFPSKSYLQPSPRGVVLIIGPWNFPLQLVLIPLAGAIAA